MIEHLDINGLRGTSQRQFTQRRQIGFGKEMTKRPRRLVRDIDFAGFQTFDQFVWRQINDFNFSIIEDRVGHRLAHADSREPGNHIIEAFDMLDIERRQDIDPGIAELFDILPAFGVATARRVGVREFIDQRDGRLTHQHGVDVEFGQYMRAMFNFQAGKDFKGRDQRFGFRASVRFDNTGNDVLALFEQFCPFAQHLKSLADAGRGPQKYLELSTRFFFGLAKQRLGGGSVQFCNIHGTRLAEIRSSCRLRRSTLMRGSPMRPNKGYSVDETTASRICCGLNFRAEAIRVT